MRKITINSGNVGLVFRKGILDRIIKEGRHRVRSIDTVYPYDMAKPFNPEMELNVLLKNDELAEMLNVVDVMDAELALLYEDGIFKYVLKPGRYAFWKGVKDFSYIKADISKVEITENIKKNLLETPALSPYVRVVSVEPYEKALFYVDEEFEKVLNPGEYCFWKNATKIKVAKVDLRTKQLEVSGQEILTKDKAALRINFFTQYKVIDIVKAVNDNKDYEKQLYVLMQLALREFVGTQTLDEILDNKDAIANYVYETLKTKVVSLGVSIGDCGVKDIILPGDVKEIMNQVLIAQKKAQANIITRREETASTRSLLNTAKLMEENEMLFKLKEMEYIEKVADKINTISVSGGNQVVEQLKEIFVPNK